jgi:predicted regulator of Ras-like GTPase activity (Roadblock/LC7/MglB family)
VLPSRPMDAEQALADLMEISSQVEAAVVTDPDGEVLASTLAAEPARTLAGRATTLLAAAPASSERTLTHLEAATRDGSFFVVRDGDRTVAATTGSSPTVGLVFYDLKTCLRALRGPEDGKPRRRSRKKAEYAAA